tara:strand:- start:1815 stop:2732 length:918 start_codon:yes stop_codon:yes gene_type:complete
MDLGIKNTGFTRVSDIEIPAIYYQRLKTNVGKIDRAFGNGILPGSIFTVTGSPGAGKTTFLLQVLEKLAQRGYSTAYASGEECVEMMSVNCKRIGVRNISVANETHIDTLIEYTKHVDALIIDSFSSLTSDIKSSRQHEKHCIQELCKAAKANQCVIGVVLHISKTGQYKGGTIIPHSVDTVIHLHRDMIEGQPDNYVACHVTKNRFGPTSETTLLMTAAGYDWNYNPQPLATNTDSVKPKGQRKQEEMNELLQNKFLTLKQAAKKLDSVQRATYILRELVILGKFSKTGRGQSATYHRIGTDLE